MVARCTARWFYRRRAHVEACSGKCYAHIHIIRIGQLGNANIGNLHYMLGPGSSWAASEIDGSLMLRPMLRAGGEFAVDVPELQNSELITSPYPNPTSSQLMCHASDELVWDIFSLNGKHLAEGQTLPGVNSIDVSSLSEGMYLLQLKTKNAFEVEHHHFVIQR